MSPGAKGVEVPLIFDCEGQSLIGIVSMPAESASLGVVIVVGGPQYRAGSHRQFVLLARALSAAGHAVLRFDVRGMGDSGGARRQFDELEDDVKAAVDALHRAVPSLRGCVLWGLCDGASAALLHQHRQRDARVCGMVLLNPWVRSEISHAKAQVKHYYARRLRSLDFWRKLASGRVASGALAELAVQLRRAFSGRPQAESAEARPLNFRDRMASGLRHFAGPVLLVLSGRDLTAREFLEYTSDDADWHGLLEAARVKRIDFPAADHTFSSERDRCALEEATVSWLNALRAMHASTRGCP